ncbi:MAG: cell division protein SepF [Clostridia bacterium]|jgi:cell division inhibitor SepF|nr:cell division protein SepF [Clostridia bacterium]MCR4748044.1 cell division protein SepF [Clostridiales bacterium]MBQ1895629.1 cell division protein SepF [Clostridia bacterium]MBQ2091636.1 cell division protein SepF [Clostridia bacterium]MBQ3897869.1 cell division protein SepF [Clostridia bacterium]
MGNFIDNIKKITGFEPEDEYGEDMEGYEGYEEEEYVPSRAPAYQEPDYQAPAPRGKSSANVVPMAPSKAMLQVVLAKPERFDDASAIADHLNEKRTVVLNLESANRDVARRLIDFLSGVAYANGGQLKRVANSTFIITPYNVSITGDLLEELENSGMFFQS